jgi:hypothetical protein
MPAGSSSLRPASGPGPGNREEGGEPDSEERSADGRTPVPPPQLLDGLEEHGPSLPRLRDDACDLG